MMSSIDELEDVNLDNNDDGGGEGGDSIAWKIFSKSKKPIITHQDSFLYPLLFNLKLKSFTFTDLKFDQIKTLLKSIYHTEVVQTFYTIFKAIAWPLWWFGVGFIAPGAVMFLGLFLLKLAIFGTATALNAFVITSTIFGVLNIGCNFFLRAKDNVYSQIANDLTLVEKLVNELDLYLEKREEMLHWMIDHKGNNAEKLAELGGDANNQNRKDFENEFYMVLRSAHYTINHNIMTNWLLNVPALKVLNFINNVFHAINSRVLFGFGCFIFVMLGLNMLFPIALPVVIAAVVLASVSCMIHTGLVAHELSDIENSHLAKVSQIKEKLDELDSMLDDFQDIIPDVKSLNCYDTSKYPIADDSEDQCERSEEDALLLESAKEEKPVNLKAELKLSSDKDTSDYYRFRFIGSLKEVAARTTQNPQFIDDFVSYASTAPAV